MHSSPPLTDLFQEELYFFTSATLVVLPKPWEDYGTAEQTLLEKILTSVKISMDAIQIVVQPSVDLKSLHAYSPARVLIFGSESRDDIPLYKETPAQGFIVIRADDLTVLDEQKKKNLWVALRHAFGV